MKIRNLIFLIQTTVVCMILSANVAFCRQKHIIDKAAVPFNVKEEIVLRSVKLLGNTLYFNLSIKNEESPGTYCLIKIARSGSITVLQKKECVPNTINQPVMYSFVQKIDQKDDSQYVLARISKVKGVEVLIPYGKRSIPEEQVLLAGIQKSPL